MFLLSVCVKTGTDLGEVNGLEHRRLQEEQERMNEPKAGSPMRTKPRRNLKVFSNKIQKELSAGFPTKAGACSLTGT